MVLAKFYSFAVLMCDGAGVSSISTVNEIRSYEYNVSSASSMWILLIFGTIILLPHFFLDLDNLRSTVGTVEETVHLEEGFPEGSLIIFFFVVLIFL